MLATVRPIIVVDVAVGHSYTDTSAVPTDEAVDSLNEFAISYYTLKVTPKQ
jgi:hypothetical protein